MEGMSTNETTRLNQAVQTAIGTISGQSIGPGNQQFAEATESTTEPLRERLTKAVRDRVAEGARDRLEEVVRERVREALRERLEQELRQALRTAPRASSNLSVWLTG